MAKSAKNQTLVTIWGRFVLGMFVFAWLSAAAEPCLMNMDTRPETGMTPGHAAHTMHQVDEHAKDNAGADKNCGHCPPAVAVGHEVSCPTAQAAGCDDLPQSNIDTRQVKLQIKDVPGFYAIAHPPPMPEAPPQSIAIPLWSTESLHYPAGPSLTIINCVFLI